MAWTMKANIQGPSGPAGDDGQEVSLRINGANIEWRLGTGTWNVLVPLSTITGPAGEDGKSVSIEGSVANASALPTGLGVGDAGKGYITTNDGHLHVWDGDSFVDVGTVRGPEGPQGLPGNDGADGDDGLNIELRNTGSAIEWRLGTGSWTNLINLTAITGPAGSPGTPGTNGLEVSLQNNGTDIQWRLGTGSWQTLVALAALKGAKGDPGNDGATGATGPAGVRGSKWFTGNGVPGTLAGAMTGDFYLDRDSGTVYELEV